MKNGIFLINKKKDFTSFDICAIVRKKMNIKKVGHTGTLDPNATGVLVVCIGEATKLVELLQEDSKEYRAIYKLGIATDSLDITGKIIHDDLITPVFELALLKGCCDSLVGELEQTPPKYSAIKIGGKKLYEYARNNEEVVIPSRLINIYSLEVLSYSHDGNYGYLEVLTTVSKGTYIRTLGAQIGELLGVSATTLELERTKVGNIDISQTIDVSDVSFDTLINIKEVLNYPEVCLSFDEFLKVKNGVKMKFDMVEDLVQVSYQNRIIALYVKSNDVYKLYRMFNSEVNYENFRN